MSLRIFSALLTLGTLMLSPFAHAQITIYKDESLFLAATGATSVEGFESLSPRARLDAPIVTPSFTVLPDPGLIGVQDTPIFGAHATEGTKFLLVYRENQVSGIRIDLNAPTRIFGFTITDWNDGTGGGILSLRTNVGEAQGTVVLDNPTSGFSSGNEHFYGIVQDTPFTQVFLSDTVLDDAFGIDAVRTNAVPAPGAFATLLIGAVPGLFLLRRRK